MGEHLHFCQSLLARTDSHLFCLVAGRLPPSPAENWETIEYDFSSEPQTAQRCRSISSKEDLAATEERPRAAIGSPHVGYFSIRETSILYGIMVHDTFLIVMTNPRHLERLT